MKRALLMFMVIGVLVGLSGCCSSHGQYAAGGGGTEGCTGCDSAGESTCQTTAHPNAGLAGLLGGVGGCGCGTASCRRTAAPGPPVGAVTYPYYTNRGPRDFLAANPPSIGP